MMDYSYYANPMIFLIDTAFSLYILVVMLRFLLQWVNAEFYNPISQFLVKVTHPLIRPLRRFIPAMGRIDTASLVLMVGLQMLAGLLLFAIQGMSIGIGMLFVWSVAQLLNLLFNIFLFAIIIRAILSWVNPVSYNALTSLLHSLTDPMLSVVQRVVPPISGIDLSPLVALIGLQLIKMVVLPPLQQLAALLG
jgi:YggT family protein